MGERARQPVERGHGQGVAGSDACKGLRQHRTIAIAARGVFLEHLGAASRAKFVELAIGDLVLGRYPRISDQSHGFSVQQPRRPLVKSYQTSLTVPFS